MRSISLLAALALAAAAATAAASPITYYFGGTVSGTSGAAAGLASSPFTGRFTYDPGAAATPGAGTKQRWQPLDAGGLAATIGGDTVANAANPTGVNQLWNVAASTYGITNLTGDWLQFSGSVAPATGALSAFRYLGLSLVDTNGDGGLGSVGSPVPTLLDLSKFDGTSFVLLADNFNYAYGAIGCLSTTAADCGIDIDVGSVPEPAPLTLVALALGALAWTAGRRPR